MNSRWHKAWQGIRSQGLRRGVRSAAAAWAKDISRVSVDVVSEYQYILETPAHPSLPKPKSGPFRIQWVIPGLSGGSGGLFNIFRMIYHLEKAGHTNRVSVLGRQSWTPEDAARLVHAEYFPVKAVIESFHRPLQDSDALVATQWETAYTVRSIGNTAAKFYFVQDLEHLFFPAGSLSEFAKETYRWGFYGITAGKWIAEVLQSDFGMDCTSYGFSFEREWYSDSGERPPGQKKRILFYARALTERRGFELGILTLALVTRRVPDLEVVLVGLRPREIELPFSAIIPGHLPPRELAAIYRTCTAALVLSHTNVSLLPMEIMACGCPVVSNSGPNIEWLLNESVAQLADPIPQELANALVELVEDDNLRAQKIAAGLDFTRRSDWAVEARKVEAALYHRLTQNG